MTVMSHLLILTTYKKNEIGLDDDFCSICSAC